MTETSEVGMAADRFMENRRWEADEECKQFANMSELALDILYALESEYGEKFVANIKQRVNEARSVMELRMVMDGLLVLAGFALKSAAKP